MEANAKFFMRRIDREDPELVAVRALERFDPEVRLLPTNTDRGIGELIRGDDVRLRHGQCLIFRLVEVSNGQARYDFDGTGH